jgi:hypothetical protein
MVARPECRRESDDDDDDDDDDVATGGARFLPRRAADDDVEVVFDVTVTMRASGLFPPPASRCLSLRRLWLVDFLTERCLRRVTAPAATVSLPPALLSLLSRNQVRTSFRTRSWSESGATILRCGAVAALVLLLPPP